MGEIPYVITVAYPHDEAPFVDCTYGKAQTEEELSEILLKEVATFISEQNDEIETDYELEKFWEKYYNECYMDNEPWEARAFINGEWKNVTPDDKDIVELLVKMANIN